MSLQFFATAAKGTEPALRDELRELRFRGVRADRGGVHFTGDSREGWRACLSSRVALRVLQVLAEFPCPDQDALYDAVRNVEWRDYLDASRTVGVTAFARDSVLRHTGFLAQKTKDAVVDRLRAQAGVRPNVDRKDPDVHLFLHLVKDQARLLLDLAGTSLHERGWRTEAGDAPLRENLAAAILRLSAWDRRAQMVDPMCGAGTIAIEADLWARRIAPGLGRAQMGFERWASFGDSERAALKTLHEELRARELPEGPEVRASDHDARVIELARRNAERAGARVQFEVKDARALRPTEPAGWIVTNPPYGLRAELEEELERDLAKKLRLMRGWHVGALLGGPGLDLEMKQRVERWQILFNGDLEVRFFLWRID